MSLSINAEQITILLERELGIKPIGLERMTFGHSSSAVYQVDLAQKQLILKINTDSRLIKGMLNNLSILGKLGLPVPEVVLSRLEAGYSFVLFEQIPGRDLRYELPSMSPAQMSLLAQQIVNFQGLVKMLPDGQGYGWVAIGQMGKFNSWTGVIKKELAKLEFWDDIALAQRIVALYTYFSPYLRAVKPTCHLDDITTKNVIVQGGALQGLIDFDVVCYGDPLFWLALNRTAVFCDVGEVGMFYAQELERLWGVNHFETKIITFYMVLHTVNFIEFARANRDHHSQVRMQGWLWENLTNLEHQIQ